jgi:hypothetical protein
MKRVSGYKPHRCSSSLHRTPASDKGVAACGELTLLLHVFVLRFIASRRPQGLQGVLRG